MMFFHLHILCDGLDDKEQAPIIPLPLQRLTAAILTVSHRQLTVFTKFVII